MTIKTTAQTAATTLDNAAGRATARRLDSDEIEAAIRLHLTHARKVAKSAPDSAFERFLPVIEREAPDGRNYVKKAVSWALRHIGKRRAGLFKQALALARRLAESDEPAARWVGKDALKDLSRPR